MALKETPLCEFGLPAPEFELQATDGRLFTLEDCRGPNGLLVMFISNHCPYVKAIRKKLVRDCKELMGLGIHAVAIMPNDTVTYPEDSLENMVRIADEFGFPFPYLLDSTQGVARAFGAVCTPDFFGYNKNLQLQYRGRIDASGAREDAWDAERELFNAMKQIAATGDGPEEQLASIGCSIKWKNQ